MDKREPDSPPCPNDTRPHPPRYWWLKRILLATGVLILALAALRWWWGWYADRQLQAKIDELRAAGQRVTIEDFQFPAVPDEENAAKFLMDAASALVRPPAADAVVEELSGDPEGIVEHADAVGRWVAANAEVLRLVRAARSKHEVDWQVRFTSPVWTILLPQLRPQRQLAKFLCTTALFQHRTGDDAAAVETLGDVLAQRKKLGEMRGFLIGHLLAVAVDALAINALEHITSTLSVTPTDQPEQPGRWPASRGNVQMLIADLLDEEPLRESWRSAIYAERLMAIDSANAAATSSGALAPIGGRFPPRPLGWLLEPMFNLDAIFMMEHYTLMANAGGARDYRSGQGRVARYPSFDSGFERNAHVVSRIVLPSLGRVVELHFRAITMRRMAATALASRLYEIDHGRRPASLDQLVPDYLPEVPVDPFAPDGRSIAYRPGAPKPVLYSIGPDGIDDGGEYELNQSGAIDWEVKDQVFFLNGDRPRAPFQPLATQPTATQAVEDDGDEIGDRGQADQGESAADDP